MHPEGRESFEDRSNDAQPSGNAGHDLSAHAWMDLLSADSVAARKTGKESSEGRLSPPAGESEKIVIPEWSRRHSELVLSRQSPPAPGTRAVSWDVRSAEEPPDLQPNINDQSRVAFAQRERIGPGPGGLPGRPPEGYRAIPGRVSPAVGRQARSLLGGDWGTETPFAIDGKRYMARVEPHPPNAKIRHWHKGVTVYEADA